MKEPPVYVRRAVASPGSRTLTWLPLLLALLWLLGTFGAFWLTEMSRKVDNPGQLCVFVFGATALFAGGYALKMGQRRPTPIAAVHIATRVRTARRVVLASAVYYTVSSLSRLTEFGATGIQSVWQSVQDPATGYQNKIEVFQQGHISTNPWLNLLLFPLGVLSTALVPLLVVHWRDLSIWLRFAGLTGTALHLAFYLFIGTMKGLADVAIMLVGGALVAVAAAPRRRRALLRRHAAMMIVGAIAVASVYMTYMHGERAAGDFGGSDSLVQVNSSVEQVVGSTVAEGLDDLIAYPTHGYLGLSYNLQLPFVWSYGLGSAPAAALFVEAFGADLTEHPPYPYRTESEKGWPADMYWATIYPWLASDLTFPGAAFFMGLLGWLFAASWRAATAARRLVPTLIFAQLCVLIVYVPANNQLGLTMESIIGMITLLLLYAGQSFAESARAHAVVRPIGSGPTAG